jgi:hypothetical protein
MNLPRWTVENEEGVHLFPSEYCQYEGAVARTLGLPILGILDARLTGRALFNPNELQLALLPANADLSWLEKSAFTNAFASWRTKLDERRDVFLAYSGKSSAPAHAVKRFLTADLGLSVLDWKDFVPGPSILQDIQHAASCCTAGVFLFMRDDRLQAGNKAAPRDNVVFEAGYFIEGKRKERVLIIFGRGRKDAGRPRRRSVRPARQPEENCPARRQDPRVHGSTPLTPPQPGVERRSHSTANLCRRWG